MACIEPPPGVSALQLRGVGERWLRVSWLALPAPVDYRAQCAPAQAPRDGQPCNLTVESPPPHRYQSLFSCKLTLYVSNVSCALIVANRSETERGECVWARVWGLRPGAALALRVAASNAAGLSPYSDPLIATTLAEGGRPDSIMYINRVINSMTT